MSHADLVGHALELEDFIDQQARALAAYGNANGMLIQTGTWLRQFDWEEIRAPQALVQLLHLVAFAFRKRDAVLPYAEEE